MVWFYCDDCGDTIKKPKLANHFRSCSSQTFTCVDCSRSFDRHSANAHSTCVSEHEKYALGATKPGGYAAQGFFHEGQAQQVAAAAAADSEAVGLEFLSERPPWRCSCCNVNCTSRETLMGHAAGAKHKRRARAAAREAGGGQEQQQQQQQNGSAPEPAAAAAAAGIDKAEQQQKQEQQEQQQDEPPAKKSKKGKKEKKDKKDKTAAEEQQQQQQQNGSSADGDQKSKKKSKKSNTAEAVEQPDTPDVNTDGQEQQQQQQQQQQERLSAALKVAFKKLKKKGTLGQKKLAKLLQDQDAAGQELLESLKKQLLAVEGVKLEGSKTFTYATQ